MQLLKVYSKQDILAHTRIRRFETRIGETIQHLADANNIEQSLQQSNARFVVFGVPENIGVKGNEGSGCAAAVWQPFLSVFLNIQSNDFFEGSDVLLLGHLDFSELTDLIESNAHDYDEKLQAYRHAVNS